MGDVGLGLVVRTRFFAEDASRELEVSFVPRLFQFMAFPISSGSTIFFLFYCYLLSVLLFLIISPLGVFLYSRSSGTDTTFDGV